MLDRASELPLLETTVLEGVEELEFRYLRSSAENQDDAWQPVWPGGGVSLDALPRAVEVSIETKEVGRATRLFLPASGN